MHWPTAPDLGPESLVDTALTDAIVKLALERFKESHREFVL